MTDRTGPGVWARTSVKTKMALIPAIFVVCFAGTIAYTSYRISETKDDSVVMDMAGRQRMLNQKYLREVLLATDHAKVDPGATAAIISSTLSALIDGGPAVLTLGKTDTIQLPPAPTQALRELLDKQKRQFGELTAHATELIATPRDNPAFVSKRQHLMEAGTALHFVMNDAVKAFEKHARARIEGIVRIQFLIGVLAMLIGGLIAWRVAREVIVRLGEAVGALERLARGDLTAHLDVASQDELGRMSGALNDAVAAMRDALELIAQNSQSLAASSEELAVVSQQVGSAAEETATQSRVVTGASEQVTTNVHTVAAAVEEMSASVREIARNATVAKRMASDAVRCAESTDATVAKLGDSSTEIGRVVKVITTIAEQTNLLALNATIEAARAGEYGKGFAVVANEVKELAKMTGKATETIAERVSAIQVDAKEAVGAIRSIRELIEQMSGVSVTIASAVEEQAAATSQIGENVTAMANRNGEIASNVASVADGARSTTSAVQELGTATADLARMASELDRLVSRFDFGDTADGRGASAAAARGGVGRATRGGARGASASRPALVSVPQSDAEDAHARSPRSVAS